MMVKIQAVVQAHKQTIMDVQTENMREVNI